MWIQPAFDFLAPKPRPKPPALDEPTRAEYAKAAEQGEHFNAAAMQQVLDRLAEAERQLHALCDIHETPMNSTQRAERYAAARKFLGRKDP
jgi:hypothetical protein